MSIAALVVASEADNPWFSWSYLQANADDLTLALREHLEITFASIGLALAVSVPLVLLVRRWPRSQVPVLAFSGVLYTVPSLALIAGLWPIFGLNPQTVVIALALYALLVILRNILVGLDGIDEELIEAARGQGYTPTQTLWKVRLPIALPTIMAGIRIATVSTVGLVTVGSLVGHGGFGSVIFNGFVNNFYHAQILAGTICVVVLALVLEGGLIALERFLTPWARAGA